MGTVRALLLLIRKPVLRPIRPPHSSDSSRPRGGHHQLTVLTMRSEEPCGRRWSWVYLIGKRPSAGLWTAAAALAAEGARPLAHNGFKVELLERTVARQLRVVGCTR